MRREHLFKIRRNISILLQILLRYIEKRRKKRIYLRRRRIRPGTWRQWLYERNLSHRNQKKTSSYRIPTIEQKTRKRKQKRKYRNRNRSKPHKKRKPRPKLQKRKKSIL